MMCLHVNRRVPTACNFNCLVEIEGLFKVTRSYTHCKRGNVSILEMVQHRDVVTTDH